MSAVDLDVPPVTFSEYAKVWYIKYSFLCLSHDTNVSTGSLQ
jgi:hypothetical protein